jgi:imidazolonepropionase-like amidohydrolase
MIMHMPGYGWGGLGDSTQYALTRADAELAARRSVSVVTTLAFGRRANQPNRAPGQIRRDAVHAANLRLLKNAGVKLAIGSDNYGATVVSEALYLSDLGVFSNAELLQLWSGVTPALIFPKRKIGVLRDGYEASFLVLEADPLLDFANTQRITMRVKQGQRL